jgi:hypothetical protein
MMVHDSDTKLLSLSPLSTDSIDGDSESKSNNTNILKEIKSLFHFSMLAASTIGPGIYLSIYIYIYIYLCVYVSRYCDSLL